MEKVFITVKASYTEFGYTNVFVGYGDGVVLFKDANSDDTMYMVVHGSIKRPHMVVVNNTMLVPSLLAIMMRMKGYIPENIRHIKTISCYGGHQASVDIGGGVTVESAHNSKEPVYLVYREVVEDGLSLEIVPESVLVGRGIEKFFNTVGQFILAARVAKKVRKMLREMDVVIFATAAIRQELKIPIPAVGRV